MKILLLGLLTISCFLFPARVSALYDPRTQVGNKLGVHILEPSEVSEAARLVNSQGGDWGYVTIPIQPTDRDLTKWQAFMHDCARLHLIPIIRITTIPQGGTWSVGHDTDLVDFANFLGQLDWPIENRYIVLFNEVNRGSEWGGVVDPAKYARIVKNAYTIFKERSSDFFLLGPALDTALPNSVSSLSYANFTKAMLEADPLVFSYFDGWASHSYPNPGFVASPIRTGLTSIVGYKRELTQLALADKPIFITETGWDQTKLAATTLKKYWSTAWDLWSQDHNVVAITPFVLRGGDQFATFSLLDSQGEYGASAQALSSLAKGAGSPPLAPSPTPSPSVVSSSSWIAPLFQSSQFLAKLENIFRVILGLPTRATAQLKGQTLSVELAQTPKQWETGLSGRQGIGESQGMVFIFPQSHIPVFWMKDMQFPIDIIWIQDGIVKDITYSAPTPSTSILPTYSPRSPVNQVLETRAGWAAQHAISIGDMFSLTP